MDLFLRYPNIEKTHDDKEKRHESDHLDKRYTEVGENGRPRVEAHGEGGYRDDDKGADPDIRLIFYSQTLHRITPIRRPIISAAAKLRLLRMMATRMPKNWASSGRVTIPTMIRVVIRVATTA